MATPGKAGPNTRYHAAWALAIVAAFVLGLFIGRASSRRPAPPLDESSLPAALCIKVLDGDTIRVEWRGTVEDVRVLGIDCPETRRGKKLKEQAEAVGLKEEYVLQYGEIARKTTASWLLDRNVRLSFPSDEVNRDSFGRLLAYVEQQGVDIGERLLLGGNAFLWDDVHPRRETYRLFVEDAQRHKKGIWRSTDE